MFNKYINPRTMFTFNVIGTVINVIFSIASSAAKLPSEVGGIFLISGFCFFIAALFNYIIMSPEDRSKGDIK